MVCRIEVLSKIPDTRAQVRKKKLEAAGFRGKIKNVFLVDVYTIDKKLIQSQVRIIASSLCNPVTQTATIDKPQMIAKFSWAVEIGFLPGVTDNVANTTKEIIADLFKVKFLSNEGVYTSQVMFILGEFSRKEILAVADSLVNPLIQRFHLKNFLEFKRDSGMDRIVPKVKIEKAPQVDFVDLDVPDEELARIGKTGIANKDGTRRGPLALDLAYMKAIQTYFKKKERKPTDIELESIAQTWSEHCKHTIFSDPIDEIQQGLFKTYIKKATDEIKKKKSHYVRSSRTPRDKDFCVSVFTDNSGAIDFDGKYLITHKVETHNSPSALDPFGGSITGIVGVNRDAIGFGLGAKPIVNTYGFCFGEPKTKKDLYKDQELTQKMLSPRRILDGVVEGVNSGGNCSGIPTPQGFLCFDQGYQGKPLVFVGTVGLIPKKINSKPAYLKKAQDKDLIVMIGGRVGQDGIHGATFSSEALSSGSPAAAVQIGDPITQKKLSDAIVKEARDLNLYHSITDNGAGGLSCSVAEMAEESGGCKVELDKVPLKYPGLDPWQIWVSESQERMTLAIPRNKLKKVSELMQKRGVESTVIGKFTNSGKCLVKYHDRTVMDVDMEFLHHGLPPRPMKTSAPPKKFLKSAIPKEASLRSALLRMLSGLNIASFEFICQQYDHEVQGTSVLKPIQGRGRLCGEATVVKPVLYSNKGIILSQGVYPSYSDIDTYHMAASALDTAVRNVVAAGGDLEKIALLDNFCWCSSNEPERLYQLKNAARACFDYAVAYETPFISGKDSMFNDFKGYDGERKPAMVSIPPTLLISSIGVIDNVYEIISPDVKFPDDLIYLLGETNEEMGGSEYYALSGGVADSVPKVNAVKNKKLYQAFQLCVRKGIVASAISVTRGGLGTALVKMAIAGKYGVNVSLRNLPGETLRNDLALFSESQGRIVVTVNPKKQKQFEKTMKGNSFSLMGRVTGGDTILIEGKEGRTVVSLKLDAVLKAYKSTFKNF